MYVATVKNFSAFVLAILNNVQKMLFNFIKNIYRVGKDLSFRKFTAVENNKKRYAI